MYLILTCAAANVCAVSNLEAMLAIRRALHHAAVDDQLISTICDRGRLIVCAHALPKRARVDI